MVFRDLGDGVFYIVFHHLHGFPLPLLRAEPLLAIFLGVVHHFILVVGGNSFFVL